MYTLALVPKDDAVVESDTSVGTFSGFQPAICSDRRFAHFQQEEHTLGPCG